MKMKEILSRKFEYRNYSELIENIFVGISINEPYYEKTEVKEFQEEIKGFYNLGEYKENILVLALELVDKRGLHKDNKKHIKYVKRILDAGYYTSAVVAMYTEEDSEWKLTLIQSKETKTTRFSYLVGENQPIKNVVSRLSSLIGKETTQLELEEAFSVGTLNEEFFENYKVLHDNLVEYLNGEDYFKKSKFTPDEFSKKLMGQVVFIYFIQKKGWLGGKLFEEYYNKDQFKDIVDNIMSEKDVALVTGIYDKTDIYGKEYRLNSEKLNNMGYSQIDELHYLINGNRKIEGKPNYIRGIFDNKDSNFMHDYLEPLFYLALNKERKKSEYFKELGVRVPFLNGGLFDHLPGYNWKEKLIDVPDEFFSNKDHTGILDIFDTYNFTVFEGSEDNADYGIDPEMLGRIFESLMDTTDKKNKGTVYTPRQIVSYMCKETIVHYLNEHTDIDKAEIERFIYFGDELDRDLVGILENAEKIDKLLSEVKVAEPSVGSGAYLVGMLQEITHARLNIIEYIINKHPEQEQKLRYDTHTSYKIKLNAIRNSLYAVDIEPSAIQITKLRLWLSLVVDDNGENTVNKLPNLDFKIVTGDSLVDISQNKGEKVNKKQVEKLISEAKKDAVNLKLSTSERKLARERVKELTEKIQYEINEDEVRKEIKDLKDLHFITHDTDTKEKLSNRIIELQQKMIYGSIWDKQFSEVMELGGFDIVIGNPPYIRGSRIENKALIKKRFEEVYTGNADILIYFYVLGFDLLKDRGILSYITSNKWLRAGYGKKFRQYLIDEVDILDIIDFGSLEIFEGTGVDVNILTGRKSKELEEWNYTDGSKWV